MRSWQCSRTFFFLFGYHAFKLSDNLITPIAPLALFRYACSLA